MTSLLEYLCSRGHYQNSTGTLVHCCHMVTKDSDNPHKRIACPGKLWRIGSGAASANREYAAARGVGIPDGFPGGRRLQEVGG